MARDTADLSQLEREFELEMDDDAAGELELEFESDEGELDEDRPAFEAEADDAADGFAERFYELSQGSYESEFELDQEVNRLVADMEQEFFFKGLGKRLRSAGKGLLKKALKHAAGKFPALNALKGVTQLARGNLKGMLGSLAKAGLAFFLENIRNVDPGAMLDLGVAVIELQMQQLGELLADGGLARAHRADEEDVGGIGGHGGHRL